MTKYINADELEKDGWTMSRTRPVSHTEMLYETKKPTDFPAADVKEVRRGKWIDPQDLTCYKCSVCREYATQEYGLSEPIFWRYCPNCGALMKGDIE